MMWERRGGFGRSFSFPSVPSSRARRTKKEDPDRDRSPHGGTSSGFRHDTHPLEGGFE